MENRGCAANVLMLVDSLSSTTGLSPMGVYQHSDGLDPRHLVYSYSFRLRSVFTTSVTCVDVLPSGYKMYSKLYFGNHILKKK